MTGIPFTRNARRREEQILFDCVHILDSPRIRLASHRRKRCTRRLAL